MIIALSVGFVLTVVCVLSTMAMKALLRYRRILILLDKQMKTVLVELDQQKVSHRLLINADLGFAKQLAEFNRQFISMDNQLQTLENKRDNDGGYQHALRILAMGGDKEEIMKSCHLSSAEAELLINLNAYRTYLKAHPNMMAAE